MNQTFKLTNDKGWKTVLVEDNRILLINKSYKDPAEFITGYQDEGMGRLLKKKKEIQFFEITSISHREHDASTLTIGYNNTSTDLEFDKTQELSETTDFISDKLKLKPNVEKLSAWKAISAPAIALLIVAGIGWIVYEEAKTLEAGGTIEITGRRALQKRIFLWLAETLGSMGTLMVAGVAVAACLFFIYKKYKTPPNQVVYA